MRKYYHNILSISDNVLIARARGVRYGELAAVHSGTNIGLAQVIRLDGEKVHLQLFLGGRGVRTGDSVRFLGHGMRVPVSPNLLGRILSGSGQPLDNGPPLAENLMDTASPPVNPVRRIIPRRMIHTGIPMIDVFNSLVISQKLPIFTVAGEPYNTLLARIAVQAQVDVIILGGMGLQYDHFLFFKKTLEEQGALSRSIFFIHTAADPVAECLLIPDNCLTVAEQYALKGKDVLVLLTDMTNFADAHKEVANSMDQIPSHRGYPGDLYSQLARRYERAVEFEGAGSVTILAVSTMPGGDITHPVPDNTGYITEGQLYLHEGKIDPFGSLSRLKQLVNKDTREDHRPLMDVMIRLFAAYRETQEKRSMGFRMTERDQKMLRYGRLFETEMMDLSVDIPLHRALDLGWKILAHCFSPEEAGLPSSLIDAYWPKSQISQEEKVSEPSDSPTVPSFSRLSAFALGRPAVDSDVPHKEIPYQEGRTDEENATRNEEGYLP